MAKLRKAFLSVLVMIFTIILCVPFAACGNKQAKVDKTENEGIEPFGLYTDLQFALNGENGQVTASVKNKFTLFPSTVTVYVDLYRSERYQEDCKNMIWVATNYIYDLDQGETVAATASTDGKQSFWKAKTTYRVDNGDWKEELSETVLFNADGLKKTVTDSISDKEEYYIADFLQGNAQVIEASIPHIFGSGDFKVYSRATCCLETDDLFLVKNTFGEAKLDLCDWDSPDIKPYRVVTFSDPDYRLRLRYSNEITVSVTVNDIFQDQLNANLFVDYSDNGDYKRFKALLPDETKEAIIELAKNMYKSKKEIN